MVYVIILFLRTASRAARRSRATVQISDGEAVRCICLELYCSLNLSKSKFDFLWMSFEFFANRTRIVIALPIKPRKNHSHALRLVFCAHNAQNAPQRKAAPPAAVVGDDPCPRFATFISRSAIRRVVSAAESARHSMKGMSRAAPIKSHKSTIFIASSPLLQPLIDRFFGPDMLILRL